VPAPRISLNVIVYNEEARLEQCLADARPHVDEIVVVDQMSTDATPDIAQRLADVYIRDVHHGHAEPSRELAASRSSGEWILVLDADETMSDLLKAEIRDLIEGEADGYWIRKTNLVDGIETSTVLHLRLVRKSRAAFDPNPHGGARVVSDNVATFDRIGILHPKSEAEQLYDDARYEQIAAEENAPSSSKRNWLSHNRTLRAHRANTRRSDLEALVPADARRVLVLGELPVDFPDGDFVRVGRVEGIAAASGDEMFDAAVVALFDEDRPGILRSVAAHLRPGGVVVGTVRAARNLRHVEEIVAALVSDDTTSPAGPVGGSTRRELFDQLEAAGLDVRSMGLVSDGWLDPARLRPDGSGAIVESSDFLLRSVPADVAEELTAAEIVFAAVPKTNGQPPLCSIIVAPLAADDARRFADGLRDTAPASPYELVVVHPQPDPTLGGSIRVPVAPDASLAARWNAGARAATGELLVFVSGEVSPLPGWLDHLVDSYRSQPDIGAVGSKVVADDDTVEHAGLVLGPDAIPYRIYQGDAATAHRVTRARIVPAVAGDGMITERRRFVEIGAFDEALGDDLADADLCLRLRARGLPIAYSAASVLRVRLRSLSGTRGQFRRSVREFSTRWASAARSDAVVCNSDGAYWTNEWERSWRLPRPSAPARGGLPAVAWSSHFYEQGGYTEEAIAAVMALDDAGLHVVANPVTYDRRWAPMPAPKAERLAALVDRDLPDDFVHVAHIGANRFRLHPSAIRNIGRTMFETDGLPPDWRARCNQMDEIWVPCEHNMRSFRRAGVDATKLHVIGETFDTDLFDPNVERPAFDQLDGETLDGFVFLSVFAWLGRKAWDVLLQAWYEEFSATDDVTLLLKADPNLAPPGTNCRREVDQFVRSQLGRNPKKGPPVVVIDRLVETTEVPALYRTADAFVLATHGEGWGRPHMEAMAMGLPTIATRWSGNLEFMNDDNSCLVDYELVEAPTDGWLRGQRWAQPSVRDLRRAMRALYEHPGEAAAMGARARADVLVSCRPELIADAVRARLEAIDRHPVHMSMTSWPITGQPDDAAPVAAAERKPIVTDRRRVNACVIVREGGSSLAECLASLGDVADTITVVEAEQPDDMASARNAALDRVSGGWVLMLDSSQTLDPASRDVVRELVYGGGFVCYTAREVHQFGMDGAVSELDERAAVLFPFHPDLRYVGPVAEQLLPRRSGLGVRLMSSPIILHQHDRRPERRDPAVWARRYLTSLERAVRNEPDEPFHLYNLGRALAAMGLHAEAESNHRRAVELAAPDAPWLPAADISLSRAVSAQGRKAEAVRACKAATKRAPDWANAWCALGDALVEAGRAEKALAAYGRALDCSGDTLVTSRESGDVAWHVSAAIGRIHFALGNDGEGAACIERALAARPEKDELRVLLARAYDVFGATTGARRQLEIAISQRAGSEAYARFGDHFNAMAEGALLRGLADNPESRVLRERIEALRAGRAVT